MPLAEILVAIGYFSLGSGLLLKGAQQVKKPNGASGPPGVGGTQAPTLGYGAVFNRSSPGPVGPTVNRDRGAWMPKFPVEMARSLSPGLAAPPKVTIKSNQGLDARVKEIRRLINKGSQDPAVRNVAISVLSKRCPGKPGGWCTKEKDWKGEAEALFHFVRRNVRYTRDHAKMDVFSSARRTLFDTAQDSGGGGDCDDFVVTLGALLMSVGHTPKIRVGAIRNTPGEVSPSWNHIWLADALPAGGAIANTGGKLLVLDASVDKPPGWEAPKDRIARMKEYEV